jgi:hypothetical protein
MTRKDREVRELLGRQMAVLWQELARIQGQFYRYRLESAPLRDGQLYDTVIEENQRRFTKASDMSFPMRKYFGRTQRIYRAAGGLITEVEINCLQMSPGALAKAVRQAAKKRLDQMLGNGPPAGHILSIDADGTIVRVAMMISDPVAIQKTQHSVYCGAVAEFTDDDRLFRVSLVASDSLAKRSDASVIAKVFEAPEPIKKADRRMAEKIAADTGCTFKAALNAMRQTERLFVERNETVKKSRKAMEEEVDRVLRTPIHPDSADVRKRAQGLEDFKVLYKGLRRDITNGDPRFAGKW